MPGGVYLWGSWGSCGCNSCLEQPTTLSGKWCNSLCHNPLYAELSVMDVSCGNKKRGLHALKRWKGNWPEFCGVRPSMGPQDLACPWAHAAAGLNSAHKLTGRAGVATWHWGDALVRAGEVEIRQVILHNAWDLTDPFQLLQTRGSQLKIWLRLCISCVNTNHGSGWSSHRSTRSWRNINGWSPVGSSQLWTSPFQKQFCLFWICILLLLLSEKVCKSRNSFPTSSANYAKKKKINFSS